MDRTRRHALLALAAGTCFAQNQLSASRAQIPDAQRPPRPRMPGESEPDEKLPNGKSMKDAIARDNHKKALSEADELVKLVQQLKDEIEKAGEFVVPVNSVRRTEDIEKLARKIRGRLKG